MTALPQHVIGLAQINNGFSGATYLPYAAGLMQAYVEKYAAAPESYRFLAPLFKRIPVEEGVGEFREADVVGFSLYVWNERISLAILKELKAKNPNVLTICGGPQVPDRAHKFLRDNPFVDVVVHGEGEKVFLEIVENLDTRDWSGISGISYLDEDESFITHPKGERIRALNEIPSPYLTGAFDELMARNSGGEWLILWETNRGCPFQCTFCDWGSATQTKVFQFGMGRLQAEMNWFADNHIEFIFCCDANFGILARDIEITQFAVDTKGRTGYPHALSVQNTKNATDRAYQVQKILADAGLNKGVTLSMQTLDQVTLENIKRQNISLDTYEILQTRFTENGVPTYSDLILGLPGETYDSFADAVSTLIENGQHNRIQFNNLSVLPNAEMGDPAYLKKYGMVLVETKILNMHGARDIAEWDVDETQQLVVATSSMLAADWRRSRAFGWMTALLHFNKLLQMPLILLHEIAGVAYRDAIEAFMSVDGDRFPVTAEIRDYFLDRAQVIQDGGPEYEFSEKWLGIWWPHDEFIFIQLAVNQRLEAFFDEALVIMENIVKERGNGPMGSVLGEALLLNRKFLKLPNQSEDLEVDLRYNILDVYHGVLHGKREQIKDTHSHIRIDRSKEVWNSWEEWCRQVVWFGNKKGAYLYGSDAQKKYYAGHH